MTPESRVYVAGHRGLVGSAIMRALEREGYQDILVRPRAELDLIDADAVDAFFAETRPEFVFLAAARVGGIHANNTQRGDFLYENLMIQCNTIEAARRHGVAKLLFLGSSCIYPKLAPQPIKEEHLLTGPLEQTNEPYAIAKIAGLKLCEAFRQQHGFNAISVMPTNLYGPGDNFSLESSHVIPALIRKAHEAKHRGKPSIEVWGTGRPKREFLHVDDLAEATLFLMKSYDDALPINVGVGTDISIRDLTEMICEVVGFEGRLAFDVAKPDGTPRKVLDVGRLAALGWEPRIELRDGSSIDLPMVSRQPEGCCLNRARRSRYGENQLLGLSWESHGARHAPSATISGAERKKVGSMKAERIRKIVRRWMFPTEGGSYMGGLEDRPVLAESHGRTVVDTKGKEYLDFQSGQMGAALGHQHPRMVAVIEKTLKKMMHASNTMLNVPRLKLARTPGQATCRSRSRNRCSWSAAAIRSKRRSTWRAKPPAVWTSSACMPACTGRPRI